MKTKKIEIIDNNKTINATVTEMNNFPQEIRLVNQSELSDIDLYSEKCIGFIKSYKNIVSDPTLEDVDVAFSLWQKNDRKNYSAEEVQKMIGSYFGNFLVNNDNMEWVFVNDEYGQDFAVRSKIYEIMSFPYSTVQKRIEDNEDDFLVNIYSMLKNQLNDDRSKRR